MIHKTRWGGWLVDGVSHTLDPDDFHTPDDFFDAASSEKNAKAAAQEMVHEFGAGPVVRWKRQDNGAIVGWGTPPDEVLS